MEKSKFNLQNFIIMIVIVGVTLVIGIYITSSIGDLTDNSTAQSVSIGNETGGFINATGYTLNGYSSNNFALVSLVILNATDNSTIGAGNYTVTSGVITNATATNYPSVLISYDYTDGYANTDASSAAAADVVDALATGTSWISILVVVGFAVVILTMLTSGLGSTTREETPYY